MLTAGLVSGALEALSVLPSQTFGGANRASVARLRRPPGSAGPVDTSYQMSQLQTDGQQAMSRGRACLRRRLVSHTRRKLDQFERPPDPPIPTSKYGRQFTDFHSVLTPERQRLGKLALLFISIPFLFALFVISRCVSALRPPARARIYFAPL